jgi:pilus assembly protein CpaF
MLNALSAFIDPTQRIVTIEDAAELQLKQDHVVRLETRVASAEGTAAVTQRDLVRNALGCGPTGSSWARSGGRRPSTCSRP